MVSKEGFDYLRIFADYNSPRYDYNLQPRRNDVPIVTIRDEYKERSTTEKANRGDIWCEHLRNMVQIWQQPWLVDSSNGIQ